MANKIKNKYEAPKSTEFTPRDLIVDVKNGHLYYKSNYAVYRVTGTLFSTNVEVITDLSIGLADNTQVLFNNNLFQILLKMPTKDALNGDPNIKKKITDDFIVG